MRNFKILFLYMFTSNFYKYDGMEMSKDQNINQQQKNNNDGIKNLELNKKKEQNPNHIASKINGASKTIKPIKQPKYLASFHSNDNENVERQPYQERSSINNSRNKVSNLNNEKYITSNPNEDKANNYYQYKTTNDNGNSSKFNRLLPYYISDEQTMEQNNGIHENEYSSENLMSNYGENHEEYTTPNPNEDKANNHYQYETANAHGQYIDSSSKINDFSEFERTPYTEDNLTQYKEKVNNIEQNNNDKRLFSQSQREENHYVYHNNEIHENEYSSKNLTSNPGKNKVNKKNIILSQPNNESNHKKNYISSIDYTSKTPISSNIHTARDPSNINPVLQKKPVTTVASTLKNNNSNILLPLPQTDNKNIYSIKNPSNNLLILICFILYIWNYIL